ncbi:CDC48 family AAA ATPase [Candidatus Woesearchaeota archaeon]|nr:CDC48 family AAA ATPase [Candidatus Woesearchaeota archaeon]
MTKELKLKVMEALQEEAYKGIVRIDAETMYQIGVRPGDIVEIEGGRLTVGIADRAYPTDVGQAVIRMDGILRRNAKTGIGESVKVRKADVKEAKFISIAPAQQGVMVQADPDVFRRGLLGRAVIKGDIVALGGARRRRRAFSESINPFEDIFDLFEPVGFMGDVGFPGLKFLIVDTTPKQPVIITGETNIKVNPKAVDVLEEKIPDVTYEDIGGLSDEIKKIREMVEIPMKYPELFIKLGIEPPKGVLLHGPPGSGKTLLAKAVANESEANFMLINGPEIMNKYYGESEKRVRDIFEEAEKNAPSIIFIDEIDAIAPKREDVHGEVERRVVAQLLSMMDGLKSRGQVVVIAATNRPNAIDPALRRPGRFDREIAVGVPDKQGRLNILKIHTRNMPLKGVRLGEIAEITHGFVGADLSALCKEAAMNVLRKILPNIKLREKEPIPREILETLVVVSNDFKEALKYVRPSAMREILVETPDVSWDKIGGLETLKQELKESVEWPIKNSEAFKRLGIRPPRGILLYGPPGTGKTLLAKAVAKESEANFILVKGPALLDKFVGESEKGVRKIFEKARQVSPAIIFFDEIDALAPKRGYDTGTRVTETVVNTLLAEMDGLEELNDVVVIAATNRPDIIDPALLRPGRFDRLLLSVPPDEKSRFDIFRIHTERMPITLTKEEVKELDDQFKNKKINPVKKVESDPSVKQSEIDIEKEKKINFKELPTKDKLLYYLAEKTDGYVGADIEAVCREAAMLALREDIKTKEVTKKHFDKSLIKIKPSVGKDIMEKYQSMEEEYLRNAKAVLSKDLPSYLG